MFTAEHTELLEVNTARTSIPTIDMATLLTSAYELGDSINQSAEVAELLYWEKQVQENTEVAEITKKFQVAKEFFAECQRFGRFHPDFHEARAKVKELERDLAAHESVVKFKEAENAVDLMLYEVASLIAEAVSANIKVPSNGKQKGGSCGSGGSCGCASGGCG
ncbi:YlbF family regulator [Paenibacillus yanchengensis]|uniref:YlbF family regulator n=1 Tax=Paenibacillus yanchengensis TaxID=2035833 RepID=A0ABW4YMH0_9BACL